MEQSTGHRISLECQAVHIQLHARDLFRAEPARAAPARLETGRGHESRLLFQACRPFTT